MYLGGYHGRRVVPLRRDSPLLLRMGGTSAQSLLLSPYPGIYHLVYLLPTTTLGIHHLFNTVNPGYNEAKRVLFSSREDMSAPRGQQRTSDEQRVRLSVSP